MHIIIIIIIILTYVANKVVRRLKNSFKPVANLAKKPMIMNVEWTISVHCECTCKNATKQALDITHGKTTERVTAGLDGP